MAPPALLLLQVRHPRARQPLRARRRAAVLLCVLQQHLCAAPQEQAVDPSPTALSTAEQRTRAAEHGGLGPTNRCTAAPPTTCFHASLNVLRRDCFFVCLFVCLFVLARVHTCVYVFEGGETSLVEREELLSFVSFVSSLLTVFFFHWLGVTCCALPAKPSLLFRLEKRMITKRCS